MPRSVEAAAPGNGARSVFTTPPTPKDVSSDPSALNRNTAKFPSIEPATRILPSACNAIEVALSAHESKHWLALLDAAGVPCGPLNNVAQVMSDPQVLFRNMIIETLDPDLGPIRMQGNPVKLSAHPDPKTREHAPELDEHRAAILKELGLD